MTHFESDFIFFVACELDPKKPDALANSCFAENKKEHVTFIVIWANKSLYDIANYSKVAFV